MDKNTLVTVEILISNDTGFNGEDHTFYNGRIKSVKQVTERQRRNFFKRKNSFAPMRNTVLSYLLWKLELHLQKIRLENKLSKKVNESG